MKVSIIIPVWNEFFSLPQVLERVLQAPLPEGCEKEIVIVDDGSTDGTTELLEQYRRSGVVLVHHSVLNFGKGTAVRVGLAIATGDIILIQDGDLEYNPNDYAKILEPLVRGSATVVYGSRFLGKPYGMKRTNWLANKILTLAANVLFDAHITDEATAYKAFLAEVLKPIKLECRRFEFCPEVTAKVRWLGHEIREVPIHYNARGIAEGKKIRWQDGFHALWTLVRYRLTPISSFSAIHMHQAGRRASVTSARFGLGLGALLALFVYLFSAAGHLLPWQAAVPSLFATAALLVRSLVVDRLLLARYAVQSYAAAGLIVIADLLFGLALLRLSSRRLSRLPPALRAATGLALGAGGGSLFCYALGALHRLEAPWVFGTTALAVAAALAVLSWKRAWRWAFSFVGGFRISSPNRGTAWVIGACLATVLAFHAFDLMMPVTEYDSTMYHISAAKLYRQTGSIMYHDGLRFNAQPHLGVLSYLRFWLLLGDDSLLKLANLESALILLLVLVAGARQLGMKDGWLLALLFLCSSPNLWWVGKIEYLDLSLTAYFAVAVLLMYQEFRSRSADTSPYGGIMLGLTGACKFAGLALSGSALIAYACVSLASGRVPKRQLARRLMLIGGLIVFIGVPWWIRSWKHTGAPFYPFFSRGGLDDARELFAVNRHYGPGQSPSDFLLMGVHLARMLPYGFGDPYAFGPCLLLLEASAVGGSYCLLASRHGRSGTLFLVSTALIYFLFWFRTGQVLRYVVPLIPVFAIVYLTLLKTCGYDRRWPRAVTAVLTVLAVHAGLVTCTMRKFGKAPPVAFSDKTMFLRSALPFYRAVEALNGTATPVQRTYLLFAQPARYYLTTDAYGDWFSRYSYRWLASGNPLAREAIARLRSAHFDYILVDREGTRKAASVMPNLAAALNPDHAELPGTMRIFEDERFAVYRIK